MFCIFILRKLWTFGQIGCQCSPHAISGPTIGVATSMPDTTSTGRVRTVKTPIASCCSTIFRFTSGIYKIGNASSLNPTFYLNTKLNLSSLNVWVYSNIRSNTTYYLFENQFEVTYLKHIFSLQYTEMGLSKENKCIMILGYQFQKGNLVCLAL